MPIEKTILLYKFEELSDSAKENARNWWRECRDSSDFDYTIEDFATIVEMMGFELRTHGVRLMNGSTRQDPNIWWQVSHCQSDHAGFEAFYRYRKGFHKAVTAYAPQDTVLHGICDDLLALQKAHGYLVAGTVRYDDRRGVELDLADYDRLTYDTEVAFRDIVKAINHWLYTRLREEDEYLNSDEQVDESILCNEYTFTANGERED